MALPILDGNQSATTLSTIVTGGQHIPAHTVVSLGSQAITDMRSAVSGSVVSISNFPSTQTIAGTVTANIGTSVTIGNIVLNGTESLIAETGDPSRSAGISVIFNKGDQATAVGNDTVNSFPVQVLNSVTIGSLPAISGTVTANVFGARQNGAGTIIPVSIAGDDQSENGIPIAININGETQILGDVNPLPISGTVTANVMGYDPANQEYFRLPLSDGGDAVITFDQNGGIVRYVEGSGNSAVSNSNPFPVKIQNSVTIGSLPAISGTVTANNPSGALTTRFGSVTTANTAQLTSAVTNTSRKYLLVQNIATSTVTIGIGFAPTTTQGIQLTAGAGLTFDAFCPTGGVWWLSSTTGSNFSILEG
jgi:hypothetical protein